MQFEHIAAPPTLNAPTGQVTQSRTIPLALLNRPGEHPVPFSLVVPTPQKFPGVALQGPLQLAFDNPDTLPYLPCGHLKHPIEPSSLTEYCPAGQARQARKPGLGLGLKVPGGHGEHVVAFALNCPAWHGKPVGELEPTGQIEPGTAVHTPHVALPIVLVYLPAGQGWQVASPALLNLPTGHGPPHKAEL